MENQDTAVKKAKLLVVDDYQSHRFLQKALLEKANYEVVLAESAKEAYECLGLSNPEDFGNGIELILMDLQMPEVDGFMACARIKEEPHLKNIPIMMVTTGSTEKHISEAIKHGSVGFIRKPICAPELMAHVKLVLSWRSEVEKSNRIACELNRSNKSLNEFALIASHDLKEPLRKIICFGEILKQNHTKLMDNIGLDYLARLLKATDRMQKYIDNLLEYAQVRESNPEYTEVDLNQVACEILDDLSERIKESGGTVKIKKLPVLKADRFQIQQLLQNLTSNALKFHKPEIPPEIVLDSRKTDDHFLEISVTDNGIGFKPEDLPTILKPLYRLNGRSEFEGTGMGMAICNEIVKSHGGTIAVRSAPGEGTTFLITLPIGDCRNGRR